MSLLGVIDNFIANNSLIIYRPHAPNSENGVSIPLLQTEETSIVQDINAKIKFIYNGNTIFWFNGNFYEEIIKEDLREGIRRIYDWVKWKYNIRKANEIYQQLADGCYIKADSINNYLFLIPVQDIIFDITNSEIIRENRHLYYFTYYFPYPINLEDQSCPPHFEKYIKTLVPDETERNKLLSFIAYCFFPTIHIQKALILYGKRHTGKTVLTDLLFTIFGPKATQVVFQQLIESRFESGKIYNKLLAIGSEMPNKRITEFERFKSMVTDHYIGFEEKFKNPITAKNITKFIFTANQLPSLASNIDESFYRRLLMIKTPNKILASERDFQLKQKLELEINQIFNFIMSFASRINSILLPQDIEKDIIEMRKSFLEFGDSITQFVNEKCIIDFKNDYSMNSDELYNLFMEYCITEGYERLSHVYFGKRLSELGVINSRHRLENNDFIHIYKNITLKTLFIRPNDFSDRTIEISILKILHDSVEPIDRNNIINQLHQDEKYNYLVNSENIQQFNIKYIIIIERLIQSGKIYEPRPGFFKTF